MFSILKKPPEFHFPRWEIYSQPRLTQYPKEQDFLSSYPRHWVKRGWLQWYFFRGFASVPLSASQRAISASIFWQIHLLSSSSLSFSCLLRKFVGLALELGCIAQRQATTKLDISPFRNWSFGWEYLNVIFKGTHIRLSLFIWVQQAFERTSFAVTDSECLFPSIFPKVPSFHSSRSYMMHRWGFHLEYAHPNRSKIEHSPSSQHHSSLTWSRRKSTSAQPKPFGLLREWILERLGARARCRPKRQDAFRFAQQAPKRRNAHEFKIVSLANQISRWGKRGRR